MAFVGEAWRERGHRVALVLLVFELIAGTTIAAHGACAFERRMSALDEPAHMSYVELVAREYRLPVLGRDPTSVDGHYYRAGPDAPPPASAGLAGLSYEAFQPPLYYVVSAAVYKALPGSYGTKFRALRLAGVAWLLLTAALVVALARAARPTAWPWVAAVAGVTLMLPGVAVRFVTVTNAAIEPPLVTAIALFSLLAAKRRSPWLLAAASATLGAAALTKLTLVAVAPAVAAAAVVIVWHARTRRTLATVAAVLVIAPLLVAPWLVWNRSTYGSWTANAIAEDMQRDIVNPDRVDFGVHATVATAIETQLWSIPQETTPYVRSPVPGLLWTVTVLLLVLPAVLFGRSTGGWTAAVILFGPLVAITAAHAALMLVEDWPALLARYVVPALPAYAVGAGTVYERLGRRTALRVVVALIVLAIVIWLWCLSTLPWGG